MQTPEEIKLIVREKYAGIAREDAANPSCCGDGCSPQNHYFSIMADDYTQEEGYVAEADLGLGCGLPTAFADIATGMTVLDLGSGAGNDVFIAARQVGEAGHVIGVDMTMEMVERANENRTKLGVKQVEFRLGEIENLPVEDQSIDVVLSNCVLNLVPDKDKAFGEIMRVLRPGGHFTVSDVVLQGALTPALQEVAELYVGCVAGALQKTDYIESIRRAGFADVRILKEKEITLPEGLKGLILKRVPAEHRVLEGARILSVTVRGEKPARQETRDS